MSAPSVLPLVLLPSGWRYRYFFFAAFLAAAFFAGAFLAAFFVAILPILPFDGLHRSCNSYIAVEECIDSCFISVKKKTKHPWKKRQQFLNAESSTP